MTFSVFIDGAAGTTGLEIAGRLKDRPDLSIFALDDASRKDSIARADALNDADIVILCLPDEAAREAALLVHNERTRIIDASSAHRMDDSWTYGFAELEPDQADRIATAKRVANPGCYPTAFLALVRPLVRAGILPDDRRLSFNAVSGYSGGGKAMIVEFENGEPPTAFRAYALPLAHKHLPEMQFYSGLRHPPIFQPAVACTYRGMLGEITLSLSDLPGPPTRAQIHDTLSRTYRDSRLIRVIDAVDGRPDVMIEELAGTDRMALRVCGNDETGQVRLIVTLDNLGKGAAGAAVQNLNIMTGVGAETGLVL